MNRFLKRPVILIAAFAILSSYLFFFHLGAFALTDPDEAFYAQTAKEMLSRHEWLTPYLYGKPQFEKPILFYWLAEASFLIFGVNEFAARLPSALFAFLGIVFLYLLGALLFNKRVGVISALIMASSVEYIILSRACVTDMVLTALMLLGILLFFYGYLRKGWYFYVLSAVSFALATLTKGPIAIILPAAIIILYLFFTGDLKTFKKMPLLWMAAAFLATALPWYILMYRLHGNAFIDAFFGFHNVTRFLESEHKIGSQWYYNIPVVFGGFFPWSAFLPLGFWHAFKKRGNSIFAILWFSVVFIFFSASSTKLPTYVFPSFIGLALITAVLWDDFLKEGASRTIALGMRVSYFLLVAVVMLGALAALAYLKFDYPAVLKGVAVSCVFLIFGFALSFTAFVNKKFTGTFFLIVYSVAIFLYPLSVLVVPQIELYETGKMIAQKLTSLMKPGERLGSESHYRAGLAFYTGIFPVDVDKHHIVTQFLGSDEKVWCVLKEKNHRQLYELDTKPIWTRPTYAIYQMGKKVILTNKMPEDGAYMLKRERMR